MHLARPWYFLNVFVVPVLNIQTSEREKERGSIYTRDVHEDKRRALNTTEREKEGEREAIASINSLSSPFNDLLFPRTHGVSRR